MLTKSLAFAVLLAMPLAGCATEGVDAIDEDDEIVEDVDDPEGLLPPIPGMEDVDVHEEPSDEPTILFAGSTKVKDVINSTCSTATVRGLAVQIAEEMVCMRPASFAKFAEGPGIDFVGSAVLPYMAPKALTALKQASASKALSINSGFRTVVQQYLLYKWSIAGRCGIAVAAKPGRSNHESGRAVDLSNWSAALNAMKARGWSHNVPGDPVHFDFLGAADIRGLDVEAFQRLWNRNHPNDTIGVDGVWGAQTASALSNSPTGGFTKGPTCNNAPPAPPPPPPTPPAPPPATGLIVDSRNANNDTSKAKIEVSSNWVNASSTAGSHGAGYLWASTQAVSDGASFWFYLPAAGTRTIDAWWTAGTNRSAAAPFVAFDSAGTKLGDVTKDQRANGGRWNTLGTWSFKAGWNRVVVSRWAAEGAVVVADAIRVR